MQVSDFLADFLAAKAKVLGHLALAHDEAKTINAVRLVNEKLLLNNKYLLSTHQELLSPIGHASQLARHQSGSFWRSSAKTQNSPNFNVSPYDAIDQALISSGLSGELQDELLCSPFYRLMIESETHTLDSRFDSIAIIELACAFGKQWSELIQEFVWTSALANSPLRNTEAQAIGFYWLRFRVETLRRSGHSPLVMVNRAGSDFTATPDH